MNQVLFIRVNLHAFYVDGKKFTVSISDRARRVCEYLHLLLHTPVPDGMHGMQIAYFYYDTVGDETVVENNLNYPLKHLVKHVLV